MTSVAVALRQHARPYLERLSQAGQGIAIQKAFAAIMGCRTGLLGGVHWQCSGCGREHWVGRSCGNRHCPTCGAQRTHAWLEKQSKKLLPGVHHFLVTFTVPEELRAVLRTHQRAGYEAIFTASAATLRDVASSTKSLAGCQLGFFGVLHTWGRDPLVYHPHVHYVVPGGGLELDASGKPLRWQSTPRNFLLHHATLIRVYKAKLADAFRAAGLYDTVPQHAWQKDFVVDIQPVDDGRSTIAYLAPYVQRVAISDHRVKHVDQQSVTYQYQPGKTRSVRTRTVTGDAFVRGLAQHILPSGFRKIRYYGWMASHSQTRWEELRMIVWFSLGWVYWLATGYAPQPSQHSFPQLRCAACGAGMRVVSLVSGRLPLTLTEHARAYLDTS